MAITGSCHICSYCEGPNTVNVVALQQDRRPEENVIYKDEPVQNPVRLVRITRILLAL